jgi:perosamine synthetase
MKLFATPQTTIDLSKFNHLLHGSIVTEFENEFKEYVGGPYAVSTSSATAAIFLLLSDLKLDSNGIRLPTMLPPVVANAVINAGLSIKFIDSCAWVGNTYESPCYGDLRIVDSAQEVSKGIPQLSPKDRWVNIYSFYPTKPVGGIDGGMIVSNVKSIVDRIRTLTLNGSSGFTDSWDREYSVPGWKMYMNSAQAYVAQQSLRALPANKARIREIHDMYIAEGLMSISDPSYHLYRIRVNNMYTARKHMSAQGIPAGIHYHCLHEMPMYQKYGAYYSLTHSERLQHITIPCHHEMTNDEVKAVIKAVKEIPK